MAKEKRREVLKGLEAFKDKGLITKKDVIENQEELHRLCTDVILYTESIYIQMLSDGNFYYSNEFNKLVPNERLIRSKTLDEVEEVAFADYEAILIFSYVSSKTQS